MVTTTLSKERRIQVSHGHVEIDTYGFCRITFKMHSDQVLDLAAAEEIVEACHQVCQGKQHPFLSDSRGSSGTITAKARHHLRHSTKLERVRKASGFIIESIASSIIANLYIKVNKPVVPTRMFDNELDAVHWLRQFR